MSPSESTSANEQRPPSLPWRFGSSIVMGVVGSLTRIFMNVPNSQKAHGLEGLLELVDKRADPDKRQRGLITVSNHICVMDDPFIFGVLPFSYHWNPTNHRWSLASHDICFKYGKPTNLFWSLGQTLPTHRLRHSPHGGLFQPTIREAVRLMSRPPFYEASGSGPTTSPNPIVAHVPDITDPFSSAHHAYTYSTDGQDSFPAPSAYAARQYAWIHVFPEGKVHQHPKKTMRYFKWGVARLILEPDVCPDIIPMWIDGNQEIMHESRKWPRFVPRVGKDCAVWFGENVGGGGDTVFHELRQKWQKLVAESKQRTDMLEVGILNDELKYGKKAVALREECAWQVRRAVLNVRRRSGLPDEDPKAGLVDTWREEGARAEGRMADGSLVKDT